MFYDGPTEFSFGDGLSYTDWALEWSGPTLDRPTVRLKGVTDISVVVHNMGAVSGSQTVLLFWQVSGSTQIIQKLIAFQGTKHLEPGEHDILRFEVQDADFEYWNSEEEMMVVEAGDHVLKAKASNAEVTMTLYSASHGSPGFVTNE